MVLFVFTFVEIFTGERVWVFRLGFESVVWEILLFILEKGVCFGWIGRMVGVVPRSGKVKGLEEIRDELEDIRNRSYGLDEVISSCELVGLTLFDREKGMVWQDRCECSVEGLRDLKEFMGAVVRLTGDVRIGGFRIGKGRGVVLRGLAVFLYGVVLRLEEVWDQGGLTYDERRRMFNRFLGFG